MAGIQFDFQGQVVMVTGGTGNLGSAVAHAFLRAGARLILVDRDPTKQQRSFADWAARAEVWLAAPVDVTDPDQARAVVAETLSRFGRLDVLVNTVGGYRAGQPVHELDLAVWDQMLTINARSTLVMSQAALPPMLNQGAGAIINVAARGGLVGTANHAAYAAAKAAVIRLTESMAAEVRARGVRVNCVLPGTIDTPDNRAAMPNADYSKWVAPESLAAVIQFLASPAARDLHGAALPIYGLG
jgi:NAD(P)-dependent dehydrogenase (short-subunit alcohol dehydrogenase family)